MAIARTIQAPGIQINEIDRSQYNVKPDYSLPGAPVCLIPGFAAKGIDYIPSWINSKSTLDDEYGTPTNEPERYFYNACSEILDKGGIAIAAKIPYDNGALDKFTEVIYKMSPQIMSTDSDRCWLSGITLSVDSSLKTYVQLSSDSAKTVTLSQLDDYSTGKGRLLNQLHIVNITKNQYTSTNFNCIKSDISTMVEEETGSGISRVLSVSTQWTNDCLGIVPVVVSPVNAMYFQQLLGTKLINSDSSKMYSELSVVQVREDVSGVEIVSDNLPQTLSGNATIPFASVNLADETVSKQAASTFPKFTWKDAGTLDRDFMKHIGIVVFRAFSDAANNDSITLSMVESFVGSLDKTAVNVKGASVFIDNIVNQQSKYIRCFSNIQKAYLDKADFVSIAPQTAYSLGFYEAECAKNIAFNQISRSLNRIFSKLDNPRTTELDIVLDAGLTNTAQYLQGLDANYTEKTLTGDDGCKKWYAIAKQLDDFCKYTRKDCMALIDAPYLLVLDGDSKIVRPTNINNTIENAIIPYLKDIPVINSSYSAGYCNWFQSVDAYSGDYFWCPPSIKAAGVYCYCDVYHHTWDAPAGLQRGRIGNTVDIAFNPRNDEAGKIYQQCWNFAISYPIDGIILEGQKTFQRKETALDRVNVRRLLLYLKRRVNDVAKYFVYEGHTQYLRDRFVQLLTDILEDVKNGSGILDYRIRCDETNNTLETIDRNELHCAIAVKPVKTIEYIMLDFILTSQSVSVAEEVLR